jgi:hypothetical protein
VGNGVLEKEIASIFRIEVNLVGKVTGNAELRLSSSTPLIYFPTTLHTSRMTKL